MGSRHLLSASVAVRLEHRLSQIAVAIKRAQETVALQKRALRDHQATRLETVELSLSAALVTAHLSMLLFKSVRPALRPMDVPKSETSDP